MNIRLVDGPFRRLEGVWRFRPLAENACKIEFLLNYEFFQPDVRKVIDRFSATSPTPSSTRS